MAFEIQNLVDPVEVAKLIWLDVLGVGHSPVTDHQSVGAHLDQGEELPELVAVVDVHVLPHRVVGGKDHGVGELCLPVLAFQGRGVHPVLPGQLDHIGSHGDRQPIEAGGAVAVEPAPARA